MYKKKESEKMNNVVNITILFRQWVCMKESTNVLGL